MLNVKRARLYYRLKAHHLPTFVASGMSICILYATRPYQDVLSRASFATAYPALVLLIATLLIGPWRVLRRERNPISSDLRRDLGIWAGILGILHSVVGQNVHLRGRPWLYYIYEQHSDHAFPLRHDLFGLANYTGAVGVLILLALLASSNDCSLRALGTPRWKQLQRWNYAAFGLAAIHAAAYLIIERQKLPFVMVVAITVTIAIAFQLVGLYLRRSHSV